MKTKIPIQKMNKTPKMSGDTGFGLGFFCGALMGAIGVYMAVTPDGKKMRQSLEEEFKKHQQALKLESLVIDNTTHNKTVPKIEKKLHELIKKAKRLVNNQKPIQNQKSSSKATVVKKKHIFKKK